MKTFRLALVSILPVFVFLATANYTLPAIPDQPSECIDSWAATSTTNAPSSREEHTAVWTGSEMIVWGGFGTSGVLNTGGRYNPSTDSWTATSTTNAPTARYNHTAVWTGNEMFVWGGYDGSGELNTGGRYNPRTDSWAATSTTNAPTGRQYHTAVWTGSEMIVWGGSFPYVNTGGRYNPGTDGWTATSTTNAPIAREAHTAVWTGSEMIIWGGLRLDDYLNTGGRYSPGIDSWAATSTTNAPTGRDWHTAVWTGSEMIVWGGLAYPDDVNTGGRYNPSTDSWTATSTTNAPTGREFHTAVWTGSEMIVWGGRFPYVNTGGRYSPGIDSWAATNTTNAPTGRYLHTAVWTGSEMIVWGGSDGSNYLNTGGRYCAQAGGADLTLVSAASVKGPFAIDLPLTGPSGVEDRSGGPNKKYTVVMTFDQNIVSVGSASSTCGTVLSIVIDSADAHKVNLNLVNVAHGCNGSTMTVTIDSITDDQGNVLDSASVGLGLLLGDVNGDRVVDALDYNEARMRKGQKADSTNFRSDVNASGHIERSDIQLIRQQQGTSLP